MIKHIWSVLCSQSVRDADSQNVSLFNVIEQLQVTLMAGAPEDVVHRLPIPLELITLWERGEWEVDERAPGNVGQATVSVLDPTGKSLAQAQTTADLSANRRCRSKLVFGGMPITISGRYVVQVSLHEDGEPEPRIVAEVPVEVNVAREEADPAADGQARTDRAGE
jgi:hypothetical protein